MISLRSGRFALPALVLATFAVGCGGSDTFGQTLRSHKSPFPNGPLSGNVAVRVAWPRSTTRVIPGASLAIRIEARQGATVVASRLLASPTTTATLTDVPIGTTTVRATAYATAGGTGVALAANEIPVTVTDGGTVSAPITLASTVSTITVTPTTVTILLSILSWRDLTVVAKDASGTVVPIAAGDWEFTSSQPLIAQVSASGRITGLLPGNTTITAKEKTSGKTATVAVTTVV